MIQPFFSRLRFYPEPAATPMAISAVVSVTKVSDVRASLSGTPLQLARKSEREYDFGDL